MVREFWGSKRWRSERWIWGSALLLITAGQVFSGQGLLGVFLLLLMTGLCFTSAWRRCTIPLFTVTDDDICIGRGLFAIKRLAWRDIKQVQQDGYGVRLIGRQLFGGAPLNLGGLPRAEREAFLQLVQDKVCAANAAYEATGQQSSEHGMP